MGTAEPLILHQIIERMAALHHSTPPTHTIEESQRMLRAFQERFSPELLRRKQGPELLRELHGRQGYDSLAVWLEFRQDHQFDTGRFGSIRGGSAKKFGIFQAAEDGCWYSADRSPAPRPISEDEAATIAAQQRDQLLAARDLILALPTDPLSRAYAELPARIRGAAPDIHQLAFVHKFLFLQRPEALDDYHSINWQAHMLLHLGLLPPALTAGLYAAAGPLIAAWQLAGKRFDAPFYTFSGYLQELLGPPVNYWRVGTGVAADADREWPAMRDDNYIAVGWSRLDDLRSCTEGKEGAAAKEAIRAALAKHYPNDPPSTRGACTNQLWSFLSRMQEDDWVLAASGQTIRGIGRIEGPYEYVPATNHFPHRRRVKWLRTKPYQAPDATGLRTAVSPLTGKWPMLQAMVRELATGTPPPPPPLPSPPLTGRTAQLDAELRRKGQVILCGPPGTGKTWHARRAVLELAARATLQREAAALSPAERDGLLGRGDPSAQRIWSCTFHPGYGYEDFIEGLRARAGANGALEFAPQQGLFLQVCAAAAARRDQPHFLVIDEINRGDVPRIFGELLTLLELDKREDAAAILPHSRTALTVPRNLYVVGTMNTADRSIAPLDAALRRRFSFLMLHPEPEHLEGARAGRVALGPLLRALNQRLLRALGRDARDLQIGHSFFLPGGNPVPGLAGLRSVLLHEIIPLLQEYCHRSPKALAQILGDDLVDGERGVSEALFQVGREAALYDALAAWGPDVVMDPDAADEGPDDDPDA